MLISQEIASYEYVMTHSMNWLVVGEIVLHTANIGFLVQYLQLQQVAPCTLRALVVPSRREPSLES